MVSFFGSSKDKEKKKEKRKAEEEEQQASATATEQTPLPQAQSQSPSQPQQDDVAPSQHASEEGGDSSITAAHIKNGNDRGTSASNQPQGSSSHQGSEEAEESKKEGTLKFGSSYVGGVDGRCHTCGSVKIACNCQHCHCCRRFLMTLSSRKHCRRCWRATCPKCSAFTRVNDFLHGEASRTCQGCAVPHSLVYLTQLGYSTYHTIGAKEDAARDVGDTTDASAAAHLVDSPLDAHRLRWGLYALGCEMAAPRRCINPACAVPVSYDHVCHQCKVPTVTLAVHRLRHVDVADQTDGAAPSSSRTTVVSATAIEDAVKAACDDAAAARTTAEEDNVFDAALPHDGEGYLFASLQGNSWAARKVLLALAACAVAAESSAMPHISLAMTELPAYTKLLRPVQVTESFTVLDAPGHVRFIAFHSGASNRSSIHQVLSTRMATREAWTSPGMRQSNSVATVVATAKEAQSKGLTEHVATLSVRDGVLAYIAENDTLRRLSDVVDKLAKEGLDVVLCGHGIGGAVATWLASTLLLESTADLRDRLMCVTFGAPLVAGRTLTDVLSQHGLHKCFQHFVHASDMVPRVSYVESLLESGNTSGTASIAGHGSGMASAAEVRDAVVMWVGRQEEPQGAHAPQLRAAKEKEGFSLGGLARRMRGTNAQDTKDKKAKSAEADMSFSATDDRTGDIFRTSREPFDNNLVRLVDETTAVTLHDVDFQRFATAEHRERQTMDPCGCFHFLWHARGKYLCTDDPATAIALLTDRTDMRVRLHDHLLSAYNRAMVEYIYSASTDQL